MSDDRQFVTFDVNNRDHSRALAAAFLGEFARTPDFSAATVMQSALMLISLNREVFGGHQPQDGDPRPEDRTEVARVTIVKSFDDAADGGESVSVTYSAGLSLIDALGMLSFATQTTFPTYSEDDTP